MLEFGRVERKLIDGIALEHKGVAVVIRIQIGRVFVGDFDLLGSGFDFSFTSRVLWAERVSGSLMKVANPRAFTMTVYRAAGSALTA